MAVRCAGQVVDAELGDVGGDEGAGGGVGFQSGVAVYVKALPGAQAAYGALPLPVLVAGLKCLDAECGMTGGLVVVGVGVLAGVIVVFGGRELAVVLAAKFEVAGGAGVGDGFGFVVIAGEGQTCRLQVMRGA